jgi:hypothetical protein
VAAAALLLHLTACGTILHPERRGDRRGGVDPAVLLLDGALLVLFVVPGLVAFGVDFYTGAIYLPGDAGRVSRVPVPAHELTEARIEAIVRARTGRPLRLGDPAVHRLRMRSPDDLAAALRALAGSLPVAPPRTG